ncbi:MAG: hypothetical protein GX102_15195 [Porphyromonadaceae bacterium]|nr:hypothetical protein [Porphyromonadaceae bacterium]
MNLKKNAYRFRRKLQVFAVKILGDELMSHIYFLFVMRKRLNLKNPVTFNEKVQYYKLFCCPNNDLIIQCSDKYKVRDYLKQKGLSEYLIPLFGAWDTVGDILWDELPDKFVLKCNHGCGYNYICTNKHEASEFDAKIELEK